MEDKILEIIKEESENANVRKYTCINGFGYSQFERNIAERVVKLFCQRFAAKRCWQFGTQNLNLKNKVNMEHENLNYSKTANSDLGAVSGSAIKPPLGLIPKKFHDERVKVERFNEVCGAIARYYDAGNED